METADKNSHAGVFEIKEQREGNAQSLTRRLIDVQVLVSVHMSGELASCDRQCVSPSIYSSKFQTNRKNNKG